MTDFTKVCWFCGHQNMEKVDNYYRCRDYGATYNDVPVLDMSPLDTHSSYLYEEDGGRIGRKRRPSKSAILAAKKARQSAPGG